MPITYEPIATTTLGSSNANITFSSIPATYTDLRFVVTGTSLSSFETLLIRFNSDTGSNYSQIRLVASGSTVTSQRETDATSIRAALGSGFGPTEPSFIAVNVFSYAGSTFKTALVEASCDRNGAGSVERAVGLWTNTAAITTILINNANQFNTGTTATLYGIKNA
jgi:hypothetical protein